MNVIEKEELMLNKEKIYITGHRHPDTDSIASAIAYAKLKQRQGFHAIACRLGPVNAETEYLLERFHMDLPMPVSYTHLELKCKLTAAWQFFIMLQLIRKD